MSIEKETAFVLEGAKKEIDFVRYLVADWDAQGNDWQQIKKWLVERGFEENEENYDEWDNHKQIDFLGAYCGFTLVNNEKNTSVDYAWAFMSNESI